VKSSVKQSPANIAVPLDSKAAVQTDYTGHYSNSSLRPVSNYVQRPALHQQLKGQLHDKITETKSGTTILVVRGLGGAGKSQLVLNYLQEYHNDYSATFWIEAGQRESVDRDFLQIYKLLYGLRALEGQEMIKPEDAVLAVKSWFQRRSGRWLVVFDSADAIDDEEDKSYIDLRYFLPDAPSVTVIITTRSAIATEMTQLEEVNVAEMEPSEAAELFIRCAKLTNDSQAGTEVELIVKELGYLALAITLAGSYVSMTPRLSSDLKQFLPEYRRRRKALLSQKPKRLIHQYGESVLGTWEISFSAIERQSPEASRLLTLLAFLHFDDIFQDLFIEAMGSQETARDKDNAGTELVWRSLISLENSVDIYSIEAAFRCLQSFSLIQWKPDQSSYTMHKLVHAWGYDRLNQDQQVAFGFAALQFLRQVISNPKPDPTYKIRLVPHLMANFTVLSSIYNGVDCEEATLLDLLDDIGDFLNSTGHWTEEFAIRNFCLKLTKLCREEHPNTIRVMSSLANSFRDLGKLDEAALMQREVLERLRRIFGKEHPGTIAAMNNLAVILRDQGKLDEAASMQKEVLEKRRKIFGEEHPDTIGPMSNLAYLLRDLGKLDEAATIMRKASEKRGGILSEERLDTTSAINNLAITLQDQGKLDEAASMLKEVLEKWRKILGSEHPNTVRAMSNLATTLKRQGKLNEAASMLKEVLEKERKTLGNEHPNTISAMNSLAATLRDQGKLEEAVPMKKEVLEKRRKILGKEHPDTIAAMNNLANSLWDQGDLDEATSMQREALGMVRRTLGEEHPDSIRVMNNLAAILRSRGELDEAASMQREVLEMMRKTLGEEHPDTIAAIGNLANSLGDQGELDEAASMQRGVLEIRRRTLGERHPGTIKTMGNLAKLLRDQGGLDEAVSIQREALEKGRRTLGENHPDTIRAMGNLANLLGDQGKLDEAVSMQREVLEKRRRILGEKHLNTITAMSNLANLLGHKGELDEAVSMQREVLEMRRRTLGEEHPDTIRATNNLAVTLGIQGELGGAASMRREGREKVSEPFL
jgi:tetratricopeptide (TPR) repeat protein